MFWLTDELPATPPGEESDSSDDSSLSGSSSCDSDSDGHSTTTTSVTTAAATSTPAASSSSSSSKAAVSAIIKKEDQPFAVASKSGSGNPAGPANSSSGTVQTTSSQATVSAIKLDLNAPTTDKKSAAEVSSVLI